MLFSSNVDLEVSSLELSVVIIKLIDIIFCYVNISKIVVEISRMSWITNLAGKAESLLEKVDKTAQSALQKDGLPGQIPDDSSNGTIATQSSHNSAPPPAASIAPEPLTGNIQRSASLGTLIPGKSELQFFMFNS